MNSSTPLPPFFTVLAEHFAEMIRSLHPGQEFAWFAGFRDNPAVVMAFFVTYTKSRCIPPPDSGFDAKNQVHLNAMLGIVAGML